MWVVSLLSSPGKLALGSWVKTVRLESVFLILRHCFANKSDELKRKRAYRHDELFGSEIALFLLWMCFLLWKKFDSEIVQGLMDTVGAESSL